jgi:hypothetical protein
MRIIPHPNGRDNGTEECWRGWNSCRSGQAWTRSDALATASRTVLALWQENRKTLVQLDLQARGAEAFGYGFDQSVQLADCLGLNGLHRLADKT